MNLKKDRRKTKRLLNRRMKKGGYGKLIIDCRNLPCVVIEVERYTNDPYGCGCDVKSLIDDSTYSCSYLHCGVEPITRDEANDMVRLYKDGEPWIPPRLIIANPEVSNASGPIPNTGT